MYSIAGEVKNARRLRNDTLLVEVFNKKQLDRVLKTTLLGSYPIKETCISQLLPGRGQE
jgi:hypothetical protein